MMSIDYTDRRYFAKMAAKIKLCANNVLTAYEKEEKRRRKEEEKKKKKTKEKNFDRFIILLYNYRHRQIPILVLL